MGRRFFLPTCIRSVHGLFTAGWSPYGLSYTPCTKYQKKKKVCNISLLMCIFSWRKSTFTPRTMISQRVMPRLYKSDFLLYPLPWKTATPSTQQKQKKKKNKTKRQREYPQEQYTRSFRASFLESICSARCSLETNRSRRSLRESLRQPDRVSDRDWSKRL